MQEQRKYPRFPFTATVRVVHANGASLFATTININRGGIGLYSSSAIEEGTNVMLDIMFKDISGKDMMERVNGKVIFNYKWHWVYVLGVEFNKLLNHENTPSLVEYIENCEKMMRLYEGNN